MCDQKVSLYNEFWSSQADVKLLEPFVYRDMHFWGSIELDSTPKAPLFFDVRIPYSYPLSNDSMSIRFYCRNAERYRHVNDDNSICLIVPKNTDVLDRLKDEVSLLKEWRNKYYIREETDERYEYLIVNHADNNTFLFTDLNADFKPGDFGSFHGIHLCDNTLEHTPELNIYYIQSIGKFKCSWSSAIMQQDPNLEGLFCFIGDEPRSKTGRNAENWIDLEKYFTQQFKSRLYDVKVSNRFSTLYVLIGYNIPNKKEIHWQIIKVGARNLPVKKEKIVPRYFEYSLKSVKIHWSKTINCSYDRFFGRGSINQDIANKNVLIIGVGAVGSSLAKVLARSGARNISICDGDLVEPGNICRAEFLIRHISLPKYMSVYHQLLAISPFVELGLEVKVEKILEHPFMERERNRLERYDYIFDCTSDMELSYVLDHLKLKSLIINLSISNGAKELVCVVGNRNIAVEKAELFKKIEHTEATLMYEGTGCWSPTFRASYFDINALINLALKKLNTQYLTRGAYNTFVIKTTDELNLMSIDY